MSLIRPEVSTALWRWRELLIGAGLLVAGIWAVWSFYGLLYWLGWGVAFGGAALMAAGWQRGRFRIAGQGPGVVRVTEGNISYFGPLTGGAVALSELQSIALDPSGKPAHWVLSQPGQPDLTVPLTADGADALFDAFASLPGLRTEHMLAQMKRKSGEQSVIWEREGSGAPKLAGHH